MKQAPYEKTKCYFCKRPIKLNRLAGIIPIDGKSQMFCKSIFCLMDFIDWEKEHNIQLVEK